MRYRILCIALSMVGLLYFANAQIHFTPTFEQLLNQIQLDCILPLENSYRAIPLNLDFQKYDFAIESRREDLEIRYLLTPFDSSSLLFQAPHIEASRLALHLATNDESIAITVLSLEKLELEEIFNADWGAVFYFKPKASFSTRAHCKLLALNAEGKGMAFVFFLFDEPSRELDYRFEAVRFRENNSN